MIGLDPAALQLLQSDFVDLLNGPDACDIVLTYETGTVDPLHLGGWLPGTKVTHTQTFRGLVVFGAAYRIEAGRTRDPMLRRAFGDLPDADIAVLAPASLNLTGLVNVVFTIVVSGVTCNYKPLEKPGQDLAAHALMAPSGIGMVAWIFAKVAK